MTKRVWGRQVRPRERWFLVAAILVASATWAGSAGAATWTDKDDYTPGSTVTILGDNSNAAGYLVGETVSVEVDGPNDWTAACTALVDATGAWWCQVTLAEGEQAVGSYAYTTTGLESGVSESGTFTDGSFFVQAVIPGGTRVAITFPGNTSGTTSTIEQFSNLTCTNPTRIRFNPAPVTTSTSGFTNLTSFVTTATNSNKLTAPATVTVGLNTYAFSHWSVVGGPGAPIPNGTVVAGTGTAGCFSGWNPTAPTFAQANYVLAQGTLVVTKTVSGGNKDADDFQFDVAGPTASSNTAFEADGSNSLTVTPGTYTVTEDAENGYTPTYTNCAGVTVAPGGTTTCAITNTFTKYASSTSSTLTSQSFTIGGSVTDSAEVTGDADGGDPGGSVRFYLCGPTAPSGADPDCSSGGTLVATDATATDAGTNKSSFSSGSYTPTAAGRYCFRAEYQASALYAGSSDYDSSECFVVNPAAATVVYTGQFDDADGPPTTLSASVTSAYQACAASRQVRFALDGTTTDYLGAAAKTATTGATTTGSYTAAASTSQTLAYDVYDLAVSVADKDLGSDGIPECSSASDASDLILTVAEPGSDAHGGGWYKHTAANPPRVNLGFTVKKQRDGTYKGQILWMNNDRWKLKGTIDGYGTFVVGCPLTVARCGVVTGTGTLSQWNGTAWTNPQTVSFSAKFYDGGQSSCTRKSCTKQEQPDWFGMQIHSVAIAPESDPLQLSGGSIRAGATS